MIFNIAMTINISMAFGFALLQLSLVFGAPFGEYVLGGQNRVLPIKMRFISGSFSLVFMSVGLSYLHIAGTISGLCSTVFIRILLVAYTAFLAYAIIGNGFITKSKKEKYIMTPCSVIGFLCSVFILIYGRVF